MGKKCIYGMAGILLVLLLICGNRYFVKPGGVAGENRNQNEMISGEKENPEKEASEKTEIKTIEKETIVIDPGHGGVDPGKVGVNNALEKDINLAVSLKLRNCLEKKGYKVVLTREEDMGLYSEGDSNKKRADMGKRVAFIGEVKPAIAVSIHQNSFTEESSKGAQVFYHQQSAEGKELAEILQETIKEHMADGNHRVAKANDSYYMLKKTTCPLVIVECGFLSNYREAELLVTEEYQQKMAEAITEGVEKYLDVHTS